MDLIREKESSDVLDIYLEYPFLCEFKEYLGELKERDILGEGMNAIIIKHPTDEALAIKIAKPGKTDGLEMEYENHKKFHETLMAGFEEFGGELDKSIKIPFISSISESGRLLVMEKIRGQNLGTRFYRKHYSAELKDYPEEVLDSMTDWQFSRLMDKMRLYKVPVFNLDSDMDGKLLGKGLSYFFRSHTNGTELGNVLDFLEWKGLRHDDLHPGNIMEDLEGNLYIIDFGKASMHKTIARNSERLNKIILN